MKIKGRRRKKERIEKGRTERDRERETVMITHFDDEAKQFSPIFSSFFPLVDKSQTTKSPEIGMKREMKK